MQQLRIIDIYPETISDGYGLRYSIYFAGCEHRCPGCHNPQSHDPMQGELLDEAYFDRICTAVNSNPILDGITLSGGDPLLFPVQMCEFLGRLKQRTGQNIWCYTGYTLEECLADPARRECLRYIDTLVEGRFVEALRDPALLFRGSSNQRIIDLAPLELFKE
ncbi:anaerobic ribonucleoside-triphosphate reductase activating protein [uncultured Alistipes sp.]|jgi:anaerobic ribonucleoside-triphosphate reductase activating protein|uniref:anaerobic ribonucleoside-triphosphate reductase activating protein n=1 Tax=uncultured Alistipes sp. TaxID=538949 RepID=UPI0025F0921A|nr:anaerobic ribonucleoside-triphosphate reductase activating protein [uncultured Alistipes sp.]